ncbi:MAG: class II glutamine amidotransferase [Alphaproteobacteria bacterium]|nr:class II glutamine amidotransferase [Alphaproteobacteria bacterium]
MCRWLTYRGPEIYLEDMLYAPSHSLIEQSLNAFEAKTPTNGDGFGLGWFGDKSEPGTYHEILPAWNDSNLRSLAAQVKSANFFAHVRASTGTATSRQNCHPFKYNNWIFMHNGQIGDYCEVRRFMEAELADHLYRSRTGTTDSELLFLLLLEFGLDDDPKGAVCKLLDYMDSLLQRYQCKQPFRMTAAFSNGPRFYALRFSTDDRPPTLYYCHKDGRLIVMSEPSEDDSTTWIEVPPDHLIEAGSKNEPHLHKIR